MTAKEMFDDLNYRLKIKNKDLLRYEEIGNEDLYITFNLKYKVVECFATYDYSFDVPIFKAIQKQIEELGWESNK